MERSRVAVSPFDGANRIRFKGSLALPICDCRLPIKNPTLQIGNRKLAIGNGFRLSALVLTRTSAPPKRIWLSNAKAILRLCVACVNRRLILFTPRFSEVGSSPEIHQPFSTAWVETVETVHARESKCKGSPRWSEAWMRVARC